MLNYEIEDLRNKSLTERKSREDDRWIAPYYHGLQDFKVGQKVWILGTIGEGCDNKIWEEVITGEMKVADLGGYLNFLTRNYKGRGCWHRFNGLGCCIFFTQEEAELVLSRELKKYSEK